MNPQNIPLDLQNVAKQYSIQDLQANFHKNKELVECLDQIGKKCTREINGLLGSKANEYKVFHEKNREIERTMRSLFTPTPEGRKIKSQFQKKRISDSDHFIKSLGINPKDIKSIYSKYQKESISVIEKARAAESTVESVMGSIPTDVIVENPDSPWHSIHPPYFYYYGGDSLWHNGSAGTFGERANASGDSFTGDISSWSQNFIYEGDDWATETTTSNILIYFQMPATGRLNIWSQMLCIESSYNGWLSDDWGWSDGSISQSSKYYMSVGEQLGIEEVYFTLLYYYGHSDGENVQWSGNMAMPGDTKAFNLNTDIVYPAGKMILMRAGIIDHQDATINDMSSWGEIRNHWILNGIFISAIYP